jgi:hypothetical protein
MFLFVLEFLFYAALILVGVVLLLNILASDHFGNAIAVILMIGICGGALALLVWGASTIEPLSWAQALSATAGILLSCASGILLRFRRYDSSWSVPWVTGLVVAATAAGGGAYLIWQDAMVLVVPGAGAFIATALIIGFCARRQTSRTANPEALREKRDSEVPQHEYKYEKVP